MFTATTGTHPTAASASRVLGVALAAVAIAVTPACDSSDDASLTPEAPWTDSYGPKEPTTAGAPAESMTVTIKDFRFTVPSTVRAGAEVSLVNEDNVEHSATSDQAGTFDEEVDGNDTATFHAPTEPGTYAFHCRYHPEMVGMLVVG
ncbi:cupredoxin domain-containing protein [Rhodococcus maanshanensis]|uniref:Plastocyanin n=1 Tax=Rhodococcus maanshanensis TaxID=183556 RepID=A0A1H7LS45_9NOCA|nr:cupredoxin domain-containing protein [Rhodococcus maanshanensis]SEL01763.1 Plastocyanin [Rhodococcus maanshanensis]